MEKVDIIIIGAGVVGLALGAELSKLGKDVVILEKHSTFGMEASSRNSEVIHAGLYYPADSLKARFCIQGQNLLQDLCQKQQIRFLKTGKLIVATCAAEEKLLLHLYTQARRNGVSSLQILELRQIRQIEPEITASLALYSPETGIIDSHQLMQYYETTAQNQGVIPVYNCEVTGVEKKSDFYALRVQETDGTIYEIGCSLLINAAGLGSDRIAQLLPMDIERLGYRQYPCKGEYFKIADRHNQRIRHLVYPVPGSNNLGIHATLKLDGTVILGPNAFYIQEMNYQVKTEHSTEFFESARVFLPWLEPEDLTPDQAGIRAKRQGPGQNFRDFIIQEESPNGFPGLINLIGIESPGLTSAPAIALYVKQIISSML
jgi:L-2-hydroxyglutarate oxidase LhgO